MDFSSVSISTLCSIGYPPKFIVTFQCFEIAEPLRSILNSHYILSDKHISGLFQLVWKFKLNEVKRSLTFQDVVSEIWNPVFLECCELVDSVRKGSMKLKEVDRYFRELKVDTVHDHLRQLYIGVEACRDKKVDSIDWIQRQVDLMKQYWGLCEQAVAANIILQLKEELRLTGNFEIIENVASRVDTSMMNDSLESIGRKNFMEAKSFLDRCTEEKEKLECLKQFAACLNIVEWMRKETKG